MIFVAGSYWGVLSFILVVGMIISRLVDEEEALSTELNGRLEYQQRVLSPYPAHLVSDSGVDPQSNETLSKK